MTWPEHGDVTIRRARVPGVLVPELAGGELVECDIAVAGGAIAAVGPGLPAGGTDFDAACGILVPGFADLHTHLDKGHIWPRASNHDGTHLAALQAVKADREANWSAEDVAARADFALRCAYAHGTVALRCGRTWTAWARSFASPGRCSSGCGPNGRAASPCKA